MKLDQYVDELGMTIGECLLTPTRLYPRPCLPIIKNFTVKGMVHITGGGFYENIPRVLPKGVGVDIDVTSWPQLPISGSSRSGATSMPRKCTVPSTWASA